jgi:hypothetical protein
MTAQELIAEFKTAFGPGWREAIVEALNKAYGKACEDYNEEAGSNAATFGFCVYHFAVKRLCDVAPEHGVEIKSKAPTFRLNVAGFEVGCHKVGDSEHEPISEAFPDNHQAAWTLSNPQLKLPFIDPPAARRGGVVIAHFGNPTDGFCAAYLALPDEVDEHNKIAHWGYTELLWQRGAAARERPPIQVALPPEETIQVPVVRRKPRAGEGA